MNDGRKAVVLLSGGMDSCVCTAMARERHGAANIALLHAGYGQRTQSRERQAFEAIADFYSSCNVNTHGNFPPSREVDRRMHRAREVVAAFLGAAAGRTSSRFVLPDSSRSPILFQE